MTSHGRSSKLTLSGLTLRPQEGSGSPAKAANKTYVFPANERKLEAITLQSDDKGDAVTLLARFAGVEQKIECGHGAWKKGRMAYGPLPEQPAAVSGAWTADDTFKAKICFYETPFIVTVSLKFSGRRVAFRFPIERRLRRDQATTTGRKTGPELSGSRIREPAQIPRPASMSIS